MQFPFCRPLLLAVLGCPSQGCSNPGKKPTANSSPFPKTSIQLRIMQKIRSRITPVTRTVLFNLAIIAIFSTHANGGQSYGTPTGTLTLTTPDSATETWPGDPKLHYVMRSNQSYTWASTQSYAS